MNKLKVFGYLYRYFGPSWLIYRLGYVLRLRTGWLRRQIPASSWEAQPLADCLTDQSLADPQAYLAWRKAHGSRFFFSPADRQAYSAYFARWDRDGATPQQEADALAGGKFSYFRHTLAQTGFPPDWHRNPFTGQSLPADRHWSQIDDFSRGDIKVIWDLSRFGCGYALVRAYWRSGDEAYPERFWQLVADWRAHNPPQQGANWKCGQETSFRLMAWCFGLYGFLDSPATTPERVSQLAQMIALSGARIEANIQHALSQHNNHGVSEGLGLWTIGLLFPEFQASARWREKGREVFEQLGRELIYADGAFAQHSANYQRLALHDYLWALRLGEINSQPFSPELQDRVKQAGEFLYQLQDDVSGRLPCFGHNDGSLVLPLDNCDYQDYRPAIQAISYLTEGTRRYTDGRWDEDLLWLFGPQALQSPLNAVARVDFQALQGGFYTLRSKAGFVSIHCPVYRHRPAHADMLNVDIWWRGLNIVLDAGTYSYNTAPPWDHPLARSMYHNAVTVDGLDLMDRVGRFLWLPWAKGTALSGQRSADGQVVWAGEHDGYQRLPHPVKVRREIKLLGDDHWQIQDRLESDQEHTFRLQWLLPDLPYTWDDQKGQLVLDTPAGKYYVTLHMPEKPVYTLVRADAASPRGWQSPYYYAREPALSLDCSVRAKAVTFRTLFSPEPVGIMDINTELVESTHSLAKLNRPGDDQANLR